MLKARAYVGTRNEVRNETVTNWNGLKMAIGIRK